jgi:hypothetical protein
MTAFVAFLIILFATAGTVGLRFYRSSAWNFVDVVYYPLAATGVALLFASNSTQRQLFELGQLADRHKAELQVIVSAKPEVRIMTSSELVDASFRLIATISELGAVCSKIPTVDPKCIIAKKLEISVQAFLKVTQAEYASPEIRLAAACSAAERLLDDIRTKEEISSLIGDELIQQYKIAVSRNYHPLDYESVDKEAQAFEQRALGRVAWLRNAVQNDDSESMRLVLDMRRSEVDFGKVIFQGLYPCIIAPKKDLDLLAKWTTSRQSKEEEINRIERDRDRVKGSSAVDPLLLWINLNLWPFVLIAALCLKFAKATATLRKAGSGTGNTLTSQPNAERTEGVTTGSVQANQELQIPEADSMQPSVEPTSGDDVSPK